MSTSANQGGSVTSATSWFSKTRSAVYDRIICNMTGEWYRRALLNIPTGSLVLDVGIGTATALLDNIAILEERKLSVVGVDYDQGYITAAIENGKSGKAAGGRVIVESEGELLQCSDRTNTKPHLALVCNSIHDYTPATTTGSSVFDVVYFSGSFMIIPDQVAALKRCVSFLKKPAGGAASPDAAPVNLIFTQTFENKGIMGAIMARLKPLFKYVLTIDFGSVTFEEDFKKVCQEANVEIVDITTIRATAFRKEVIVRARPRTTSSA
jgi:SAM-dependent methyltransferase